MYQTRTKEEKQRLTARIGEGLLLWFGWRCSRRTLCLKIAFSISPFSLVSLSRSLWDEIGYRRQVIYNMSTCHVWKSGVGCWTVQVKLNGNLILSSIRKEKNSFVVGFVTNWRGYKDRKYNVISSVVECLDWDVECWLASHESSRKIPTIGQMI